MRIAVTGSTGQVVRSLLERGPLQGQEVVSLGRPKLDLSAGAETVVQIITEAAPDIIVSAAAYTNVDKAEADPHCAFLINEKGAASVALAAADLDVPLIHLSTDYVFDGTKTSPYREEDCAAPPSVYGQSKLSGETAVRESHENSVILRTAWVYSPFGANFVKTMLRLADEHDSVRVVGDQQGNPTSALDLADAILAIAANLLASGDSRLRGIFHCTASGTASWAEFASAIFAASALSGGPTSTVVPITTAEYPTPAQRPANSRLDCKKLAAVHGVSLPAWPEFVSQVVRRLIRDQSEAGTTK